MLLFSFSEIYVMVVLSKWGGEVGAWLTFAGRGGDGDGGGGPLGWADSMRKDGR